MKLSVHHVLPCGCVLQHSTASEGDYTTPGLIHLANVIDFWVQNRTATHDCALVSPENPTGRKRPAQETPHG